MFVTAGATSYAGIVVHVLHRSSVHARLVWPSVAGVCKFAVTDSSY